MSNSLSLYHLTKEYENLFAQLYDPDTGEINQEVEEKVNSLLPTIEAKCISVANYIKKLESDKREIEFLEQEIQKRKTAYTEEVKHWQEYLKKNMQYHGLTKVSCPYFTLNIKKNRHSTDIYDEFQIPTKFMIAKETIKVEVKPDKEAIKEEVLRTGVQVPGAHVEQKSKLEMLLNKI